MPVRTHMQFGNRARAAMRRGIMEGLRLVETTLGPRGRMVVMHTVFGDPFSVIPPKLSRDGETVLAAAEIGSPIERIGIHLLQRVASEMRSEVGDGTTTCIVLAGHLALEMLSLIERGISPDDMVADLEEALPILLSELRTLARSVAPEILLRLPHSIGGGSTHLGEWVVQALDAVGFQGRVHVAVDDRLEAPPFRLEIQQEATFHWPLAEPHLCSAEGPALLCLSQQPLEDVQATVSLLEHAHEQECGIVFVAPGYSEPVLELLTLNVQQGTVPITALRIPHTSDWRTIILHDLAFLSQGEVVDVIAGATYNTVKYGSIESLLLADEQVSLRFRPVPEQQMRQRVNILQTALARLSSPLERERIQERLSFLLPTATLWLAAPTQVLAANRVTLAYNALAWVRAAVSGGVVPGGGVALWQLGRRMEGSTNPVHLALARALVAPLQVILRNAGVEYAFIRASLSDGTSVYDVEKREVVDPWQVGLLDPVPVIEQCIRKAISMSSLLARTETCLVQEPVEAAISTYERAAR